MASKFGINSSQNPWRRKTIADGSATTLLTYPLAAGEYCAGVMHFCVFGTDGTDITMITGIATYGALNKAGTVTGSITYDTANEAKNVSGGATLTLSFTDTDDTNAASFKLTPTGSLTETTYYVRYQIVSQFGNKVTTAV